MPWSRPTFTQLLQQGASDLLSGVMNLLNLAFLSLINKALTVMVQGQYGYLDYGFQQATPATATDPITILAWGALKNLTLNDAVAATGTLQFSGTAGTPLAAGFQINRQLDGASYVTTAAATVASNAVLTVEVQCTTPGAQGTLEVGQAMVLSSSLPGISSAGTVTATVTPGADIEDVLTEFKPRVLAAFAQPAQGGSAADYVQWALEFPGVTRAWVKPGGMGPGTVVVYIMLDASEAAYNGFPQGQNGVSQYDNGSSPRGTVATGDQLAVADYICQGRYALKGECQPVCALVYLCAPISTPVNFTITGLSTTGATVQANVEQAIAGVFLREGGPGGAQAFDASTGQMTTVGTVDIEDINTAIQAVSGTSGFVITAPTTNIAMGAGQLPVVGAVTFA